MEDKNKENNIDNEFTDINKESKFKPYIIVGVLYLLVIILSILLFIGLKHQKNTINDSMDKNNNPISNEYNSSFDNDVNNESKNSNIQDSNNQTNDNMQDNSVDNNDNMDINNGESGYSSLLDYLS